MSRRKKLSRSRKSPRQPPHHKPLQPKDGPVSNDETLKDFIASTTCSRITANDYAAMCEIRIEDAVNDLLRLRVACDAWRGQPGRAGELGGVQILLSAMIPASCQRSG
jgi:hypothetical protein